MELNITLPEPNQDLDNLKKSIEIFSDNIEQQKDNEQLKALLCRSEIILKTLIQKMEKTQAEFFTNQLFKELNTQIININNNIINYLNTRNESYKIQANSHIDTIINIMPRLCFNDKETIKESLSVTVGNYKKTLSNYKQKLKTTK